MLILLGLVALLAYCLFRYYSMVRRYPPGPFPLPAIGNMLQQDFSKQHPTSFKFAQNFDGVYTVFAPQPIVILSDYETIKEAFLEKGEDFVARPESFVMDQIFLYTPNSGVINSNGDPWRETRRASLAILKDLGMGKNIMEELVLNSVREYLECLDNNKDKEKLDLNWPIQMMTANIINEILFGHRYKYDDCDKLITYVEDFKKWFNGLGDAPEVAVGIAAPALLKIPYVHYWLVQKHRDNMLKVLQYIIDCVQNCLAKYNIDDEPSCFVHAYKRRMHGHALLDDNNLITTCHDFFRAGQDTTTTTLRWAMLFMAVNQDAQERLRREIYSVVGKDRLATMADKAKMIYTQATVLEVHRMSNVIGTNLFHMTTRDTVVKGHPIPKGTFVNGDIHYVLGRDPLFVDPDSFRPGRFLNQKGTALRKELVDRVIAFGLGKRACPGEGLSRMEVFLVLTATIQNYRILPVETNPIDLEPLSNIILQPKKDQFVKIEKI